MNPNYERGVRLEREVVKIFKNAGWKAQRTAGSKSEWDVVLIKETEGFGKEFKKIVFVAFVQCKVKKR